MQLSMKCSIAIHCLIFINEATKEIKVTSNLLAESTGTNPVIIRNIMSSLNKANLISIKQGTGGTTLCLNPSDISLYEIYHAVEPKGLHSLIGIHKCKDQSCPVAQNIGNVLEPAYQQIADSIKTTMQGILLDSLIDDFHLHLEEAPE